MFNWLFPKKEPTIPAKPDWKAKAEGLSKKLLQVEREKRATENLTEVEQWHMERQENFNRKLKILQLKFHCHVCGKLPTGPMPARWKGSDLSGDWELIQAENWNFPDNLQKCIAGNHWVCSSSDCIHNGVCKKCAEKM